MISLKVRCMTYEVNSVCTLLGMIYSGEPCSSPVHQLRSERHRISFSVPLSCRSSCPRLSRPRRTPTFCVTNSHLSAPFLRCHLPMCTVPAAADELYQLQQQRYSPPCPVSGLVSTFATHGCLHPPLTSCNNANRRVVVRSIADLTIQWHLWSR